MEQDDDIKTDDNVEALTLSFTTMFDTINVLKKTITNVQTQLKSLEKQVKKNNKKLQKQIDKGKEKKPRKPSGFAQPTKISKELCEFMNVSEDTEMARTEVTKFVIRYIKDNQLQSENEKNVIIPDEKLQKILENTSDDKITFFNIQKYMNKNFKKESML